MAIAGDRPTKHTMAQLTIDVWSDIACPWCWIGKRRLEVALSQFEHREQVDVVWHAFELDPGAPKVLDMSEQSYAGRLANKYGTTVPEGQAMITRMTAAAADDGIEMRFDRIQPGNTFDCHRLLHHARSLGVQTALKERLLRAYLGEGESIGDVDVLGRLASEVGVPQDEAEALLAGDEHAEAVRRDEAQAATIGIRGVPFFVFEKKYAVSGAQPAETLLEILDRTWNEVVAPGLEMVAEGATCGPEGCS